MFESFDSTAVDAFVDVIRTDAILRRRISSRGQLNRLRVLGQIALDKGLGSEPSKQLLELLVDDERTGEFFSQLPDTEG